MDGNKDEALKCLRIGKEAFEAGDRTRALKFTMKARRLDPSLPVDDLLSEIQRESGDQSAPPTGGATEDSASASSKPFEQSSLRHRVPANGSSSSSSASSIAYTEEQILIVRQIKKKKDYYEILGVEKNCTVEDVRKAYRKLSLKVHPDKNKAPGAEEAFKAVSKAFQCLSNEESRKKYDLVGSDEPVYERRAARHAAQGFNGYYEADIDPDEIFRNFFFGGMQPTQFRGFSFGTGVGPRTGDHGSGCGLMSLSKDWLVSAASSTFLILKTIGDFGICPEDLKDIYRGDFGVVSSINRCFSLLTFSGYFTAVNFWWLMYTPLIFAEFSVLNFGCDCLLQYVRPRIYLANRKLFVIYKDI